MNRITRQLAAIIFVTLSASAAIADVMNLTGTTATTFKIDAGSASPVTLTTDGSGRLQLSGGLRIPAGTIDLSGATVSGGTINSAPLGATTPASGTFTALTANNGLTVTGGTVSMSGITVSNGGNVTTIDINGGTIDSTSIGSATPGSGAFTTLSASSQITSSLSTGTAPMSIASTTKVSNLNVDAVDGVSITAGSAGAVSYQSDGSTIAATSVGTSGQLLVSGGSGAPTWAGLSSGKIFVGGIGDTPAEVDVSGDATLSFSGALTIASSAVTAAKLADAVADEVAGFSVSAGAESSDVIRVTVQMKDAQGNNLARAGMVSWVLSSDVDSAAITIQSATIALVDGTQWQQITSNKKYVHFTDSTGKLTIDVTLSGDVTIQFVAAVAGKVTSLALDYD